MTDTRRLGVVAVAVLAVIVAGCSSSSKTGGGGGAITRVEVQARDFGFAPSALTLKTGQQYTVVFKNTGSTLHDLTIDAIPSQAVTEKGSAGHEMGGMATPASSMAMPAGGGSLHVAADAGKTANLTFTPTMPGEYEFVCTVPGHRELGMRGRLMVQG